MRNDITEEGCPLPNRWELKWLLGEGKQLIVADPGGKSKKDQDATSTQV